MLGLKKKQEIVIVEHFNLEEAIEDIEAKVNEEGLKEYARLAKSVGHTSIELETEKFLLFLKMNQVTVYNYNKVHEFLDQKYGSKLRNGKEKPGWVWYTLKRYQDGDLQSGNSGGTGHIESWDRYDKPIPLNILKLISKLEKKRQDLRFYISDLYRSPVRKPDPFLMMGIRSLSPAMFVIAQWDEPNFK